MTSKGDQQRNGGKSVKKIVLKERTDTTFYRFDSKLGFWGIPNIEGDVSFELRPGEFIRVSHNVEGNRDRNFVPTASSKKPILCFGGSNTWGGGVEQELRYTNRLEKVVSRRVLNVGHCSFGLDQVCLALIDRVDHYSPSVVVVEQYPWAVHRVLSAYVNGYLKPHFYLDSGQELRLNKISRAACLKPYRKTVGSFHFYRKEFQEFLAGIDLHTGYNPQTDPIFLLWKLGYYDYMYRLIDKILGVMQDLCRQKNVRLLFALGAVAQRFQSQRISELIDYDLPSKKLVSLFDKHGIQYVDMAEPMAAEHCIDEPVIFPDGHINVKGHRLFAEVLFKKLERLAWL